MFSLLSMNTLYERLLEMCRDRGEARPNGRSIQDLTGLSSGRVSQIKNDGPKAKLSGEVIQRLNALGYSTDWVLDGKGSMKLRQPRFDQNVIPAKLGRTVPIIDYVQAGAWHEVSDPFPPGMAFETMQSSVPVSENAFALYVQGDSMEPEFFAGDVIVIDPQVSPRPGSFVVAKNGGNEATFKKYRARGINPETGEEIFELVPLNSDYSTMRSDEVHCVIIGTAVEVRKKLK